MIIRKPKCPYCYGREMLYVDMYWVCTNCGKMYWNACGKLTQLKGDKK